MLKVLLFLCFLLVLPSVSSANYEMTGAELEMLDQNMEKLQNINSKSQAALMSLGRQLNQSKRESAELKQESTHLESQLAELRKISDQQKQSLLRANESLDQYAKEQKRKVRKIKFQRNTAWICFAIAVIAAISK